MRYLMKSVKRSDRIRNAQIRKELGQEPITNAVERKELRWFGHAVMII